MAQFYFHLWDGERYEFDEVGLEMADAHAAYLAAFSAAEDIWIEALRGRRDASHNRFYVANDAGRIVFELPFVEIVRTAPRGVLAPE
jgi:hypothetical protein